MSANEAETRARAMGWLPKEQFRGQEDRWLPAEQYLERGEAIMPILQANNKRLTDRLSEAERANQELKASLAAASEAIEGLKEFRSTLTKEKAREQKTELTKAIVEARNNNDVTTEVELTEKLGEVTAALKEAEKPVAKPSVPETPQLTQAAKDWQAANPWFATDVRKRGYAMGLMQEWQADGKRTGTPEFFAFVDREMAKAFDANADRRERPSKVDGANHSSAEGSPSGNKTFADLPLEAQQACDRFGKKFVGKDRAYATQEEWRKKYLSEYNWS